jgi:hypothetical protein
VVAPSAEIEDLDRLPWILELELLRSGAALSGGMLVDGELPKTALLHIERSLMPVHQAALWKPGYSIFEGPEPLGAVWIGLDERSDGRVAVLVAGARSARHAP